MAPRTRHALLSVTFFLIICAISGALINKTVTAQSASDVSSLSDSLRSFTDAYAIVEQNYAEKLDSEKISKAIYDGAIPAMLHTLDPHSTFYDPSSYAQMLENEQGSYFGVGMSIQPRPDRNGTINMVVLAPYEGTPSFKAGIRPGDIIMQVDSKPIAGMDSAAVSNLLKGPKGTHVSITLEREGSPKPLVFDLVRNEIPHPSVHLAFMIRPGIGYIHVLNFSSETTAREVADALNKFDNLNGLVLDLRGNPGGLFNQAVDMADQFLQKGQIVVSQKGRAFPDEVYRVPHGEQGKKYPIVVLVNRNTASASEIVSGALQDHDRALIVGETTFGKGLVQKVFQLSENTGLALTTYHYYTPSGRLIQRDYNGVSLYDYYYVRDDAAKPDKSNLEVKLTDSGRIVYGGGGITPDEKIPDLKENDFQSSLIQNYAFFDFSRHYLASHTVSKDFAVDDVVLRDFKDFLKYQQIAYTDSDINGVIEWVKENIKSDLFTSQFGQLEGLKIRASGDPQIAKAISFIPEAEALEQHLLPSQTQGNAVVASR